MTNGHAVHDAPPLMHSYTDGVVLARHAPDMPPLLTLMEAQLSHFVLSTSNIVFYIKTRAVQNHGVSFQVLKNLP